MAHYLESGVSADEKVMFPVDTMSPAQAVERIAGITPNLRSNSNLSVLTVHPYRIVHGQLLMNPYYAEPGVVLKRLSQRNGRAEERPPDAS
jgi:hypothetical protein